MVWLCRIISRQVLIETSWNVKKFDWSRILCSGACINRNIVECKEVTKDDIIGAVSKVLIETSWNVKLLNNKIIRFLRSINRNIVECKGLHFWYYSWDSSGINRNIVECKGIKSNSYAYARSSINRNIVECKVGFVEQRNNCMWY